MSNLDDYLQLPLLGIAGLTTAKSGLNPKVFSGAFMYNPEDGIVKGGTIHHPYAWEVIAGGRFYDDELILITRGLRTYTIFLKDKNENKYTGVFKKENNEYPIKNATLTKISEKVIIRCIKRD